MSSIKIKNRLYILLFFKQLCNVDRQIHVRVEFESDAQYIKAFGFDPTRKDSIYIEAVPKNKDFKPNPRESKRQVCYIECKKAILFNLLIILIRNFLLHVKVFLYYQLQSFPGHPRFKKTAKIHYSLFLLLNGYILVIQMLKNMLSVLMTKKLDMYVY